MSTFLPRAISILYDVVRQRVRASPKRCTITAEHHRPVIGTKTVPEVRRTFSGTLKPVHEGETRVVIEKNGIPIVSSADVERLRALDERAERAMKAFERIQAECADTPEDELEQELAKALAEAKDVQRQKRERGAKKLA